MQCYIDLEYIPIEETNELQLFFHGCDFNCPYCNVSDLLKFDSEKLIEIRQVKQFIQNSNKNSILFTGGEPTLQRQSILSLARFAKKNNKKTILHTNGSRPDAIKSLLISEVLDEIRIDIRSPFENVKYEKITKSKTFFITTETIIQNIKRTLKLMKEFENQVIIEFITPIVPSLIYKTQDIKSIHQQISNIKAIHTLKPFIPQGNFVNKNFENISSPTRRFIKTLESELQQK